MPPTAAPRRRVKTIAVAVTAAAMIAYALLLLPKSPTEEAAEFVAVEPETSSDVPVATTETPQPVVATSPPPRPTDAVDPDDGFLDPVLSPVTPLAPLPEESDAALRLLNLQYHAKRARLRQYQKDNNLGQLKVHTFYTVDCTLHSLWQVLALEDSWNDVRQGGFISRVISGCAAGNEKTELWTKTVLPPAVAERRFGAYFAPKFGVLPSGEFYAPYNRPNAIWYWLNHTDLTEQIFVLTDPDMLFMHRLHVGNVRKGEPVAQYYSYMSGARFDKYQCELCPDYAKAYEGGGKHVKRSYDVGPPWMLHVDDFKTIMKTWVALVPMLKMIENVWITEMLAYSVACAYHGLPHTVIQYGMVDNVNQEHVWDGNTITKPTAATDGQEVALLHYCYTWEVGEPSPPGAEASVVQMQRMIDREAQNHRPVADYYHWSKYRTPSDWDRGEGRHPHNILRCNAPLMQEFHTTEALPVPEDSGMYAGWKRTMFFLRTYLPALNKALRKWKLHTLNCSIPTPEEEEAFERAMQDFKEGKGTDPTGVNAAEHYKGIINLAETIRTSHPSYWVSDFVITHVNEDLKTVDFEPSSTARRRQWSSLRHSGRQ